MSNDNDIKELLDAFGDMTMPEEENISIDIIPKKCQTCKNNVICNALQSYISLLKMGIKVQIEVCDFYNEIR